VVVSGDEVRIVKEAFLGYLKVSQLEKLRKATKKPDQYRWPAGQDSILPVYE
jgi:hypothetical protein